MVKTSTRLSPAPAARFVLPKKTTGVLDEEQRELALVHARDLLSVPTAPYAEDGEVDVIRRFVAERKGFGLRMDRYANLIVTWKGRGKKTPKNQPVLAFSAHLDHPGFLYSGKRKGKHTARFHGGLPVENFAGSPVRFFDCKNQEVLATATVARARKDKRRGITAELKYFKGIARRGMFGMWDLTPGQVRGTRMHSRVCDDLIGAAALLATLDILAQEQHPYPVIGIFTRAEETGFTGCQGLLRSGFLKRKKIAVVGLECSSQRSHAKLGDGPIIRVGDRMTIFDPEITRRLQLAGVELARECKGFKVQRALMDGGACESTAYNLWGVPAGALCVALGNYHNHCKQGGVAAEFVDWSDHEGMIALMVRCAKNWHEGRRKTPVPAILDKVWAQELSRLERSTTRLKPTKALGRKR